MNLYSNPIIEKNIYVDVIDNNGNLLYSIVFEKCRFIGTSGMMGLFDYKVTDLNRISLNFMFKNVIILAPNEDLKCDNQ